MAEALVQMIDALLQQRYKDDQDMLIMANLAEVKMRLQQKMLHYKEQYKLKLTAAQALALRLLYTDFVTGTQSSYVGNYLRQLAEQVHQNYHV